jgi:hypothetical protein
VQVDVVNLPPQPTPTSVSSSLPVGFLLRVRGCATLPSFPSSHTGDGRLGAIFCIPKEERPEVEHRRHIERSLHGEFPRLKRSAGDERAGECEIVSTPAQQSAAAAAATFDRGTATRYLIEEDCTSKNSSQVGYLTYR